MLKQVVAQLIYLISSIQRTNNNNTGNTTNIISVRKYIDLLMEHGYDNYLFNQLIDWIVY